MIEATRIETQEVERPDLHIYLRKPVRDASFVTSPSIRRHDSLANDFEHFLLPGTRREKLTKEREKLIADVVAAVRAWDANETVAGTTVINAARRLADFDRNLLALDAEGVKG